MSNQINVLLADDDEPFLDAYGQLLRLRGLDCVTKSNCDDTEAHLRSGGVDVLVADINMPGNSRLELVENVLRFVPDLPIILLTGGGTVESAAKSVRLGVAGYLLKPPNLDELVALIQKFASRHRRRRVIRENQNSLKLWAEQLADLEERLSAPSPQDESEALRDYLRVTLRNVVRQLMTLDSTFAETVRLRKGDESLQHLDLVHALKHSIEVLEKSRQSFHSKDLGNLRKQLQKVLETGGPGGPLN